MNIVTLSLYFSNYIFSYLFFDNVHSLLNLSQHVYCPCTNLYVGGDFAENSVVITNSM